MKDKYADQLLEEMVDRQKDLKSKTRKRLKSLAMNFLLCENGWKAGQMFCTELPQNIDQDRCYRNLRRRLEQMGLNPVPVPADVHLPVPSLAMIVETILESGYFSYQMDPDALSASKGA